MQMDITNAIMYVVTAHGGIYLFIYFVVNTGCHCQSAIRVQINCDVCAGPFFPAHLAWRITPWCPELNRQFIFADQRPLPFHWKIK